MARGMPHETSQNQAEGALQHHHHHLTARRPKAMRTHLARAGRLYASSPQPDRRQQRTKRRKRRTTQSGVPVTTTHRPVPSTSSLRTVRSSAPQSPRGAVDDRRRATPVRSAKSEAVPSAFLKTFR